MNKFLRNAKGMLVVGVVCLLIAVTAQSSTKKTITQWDDFSVSQLSSFWVADIDSGAFASGGGMVIDDVNGILRFNNVWNNSYAHLQSASPVDVLRVDAIMFQTQNQAEQSWGMAVAIYFDPNNYVALKQCDAGGAYGWGHCLMVNGTIDFWTGYDNAAASGRWLISGIELTPTEIIYYGSPLIPAIDMFNIVDIDGHVDEIAEFREARPASFTGPATIIIGKGYTDISGGLRGLDFDNSVGGSASGFSGIDLVRVRMNIDDPSYCKDAGTVYLPMDFNQDCQVNFKDLAVFAPEWLKCTDPAQSYCDQFWRD